MATAEHAVEPRNSRSTRASSPVPSGLISSTIIATASVAPAYSLAATLGFVVAAVGLQSPAVAVLAFVPMLLTSIGYSELNKADPDCGTTFTWATRAFGPKTGWAGGWAIVAADVLVMASLAQVAGQYVFLLFDGRSGIGSNPTSGWVLLVGVAWIIVMTYYLLRGIEVSANFQKVLLSIELIMLLVLSIVPPWSRWAAGMPARASHAEHLSWFNPFKIKSFSTFTSGIILMVFIYWGWDTAVAVNEETKDRNKTPGRAAILSTVILLVTYALVITSMQAFAGSAPRATAWATRTTSATRSRSRATPIFGADPASARPSCHLLLPDGAVARRPPPPRPRSCPPRGPRCRWRSTRRSPRHSRDPSRGT